MRAGALFVGAIALFAVLGLLAGGGGAPPSVEPTAQQPQQADDASKPSALARRWGHAFAVWSHDSLDRQLRELAATAIPQLALDLRRAAEAVRRDSSLRRDGAGSEGSVEVVQVQGNGHRRRVIVVTRERPYFRQGTDLQGARYRVYVGVLRRDHSGRWLMHAWERQP